MADKGVMGRSPDNTMQYTPGWDWIQPVRRNTGIWDEVVYYDNRAGMPLLSLCRDQVPGVRDPKRKLKKEAF